MLIAEWKYTDWIVCMAPGWKVRYRMKSSVIKDELNAGRQRLDWYTVEGRIKMLLNLWVLSETLASQTVTDWNTNTDRLKLIQDPRYKHRDTEIHKSKNTECKSNRTHQIECTID